MNNDVRGNFYVYVYKYAFNEQVHIHVFRLQLNGQHKG